MTENAYTPLNFADPKTGQGIGWEYDAFNEIGKRLNAKVEWNLSSWDVMIQAIKDGQYDVGMDGITINDERKQQVDFTDPYMTSQQFMLVRADESRITSKDDFKANTDLLIGAQAGTSNFYAAIYDVLDGDKNELPNFVWSTTPTLVSFGKDPLAPPQVFSGKWNMQDVEAFVVAGITDHITPWRACYETARIFGSKSLFVLANAGPLTIDVVGTQTGVTAPVGYIYVHTGTALTVLKDVISTGGSTTVASDTAGVTVTGATVSSSAGTFLNSATTTDLTGGAIVTATNLSSTFVNVGTALAVTDSTIDSTDGTQVTAGTTVAVTGNSTVGSGDFLNLTAGTNLTIGVGATVTATTNTTVFVGANNAGSDNVVRGTLSAAGIPQIIGAGGNDVVLIDFTGGASLPNGANFDAAGGTADELQVSDALGGAAHAYVIGGTDVTRDGTTDITVGNVESIDATGGNLADTFTVVPSPTVAVDVHGGTPTVAPGDTLTVLNAATAFLSTTPSGGSVSGTYDFPAGTQDVTFAEIETLNTGADAVAITKDDGITAAVPGTTVTYTVVVTNTATVGLTGISVADVVPAAITGVSWSAAFAGVGSTGTANGTGSINQTIALAARSQNDMQRLAEDERTIGLGLQHDAAPPARHHRRRARADGNLLDLGRDVDDAGREAPAEHLRPAHLHLAAHGHAGARCHPLRHPADDDARPPRRDAHDLGGRGHDVAGLVQHERDHAVDAGADRGLVDRALDRLERHLALRHHLAIRFEAHGDLLLGLAALEREAHAGQILAPGLLQQRQLGGHARLPDLALLDLAHLHELLPGELLEAIGLLLERRELRLVARLVALEAQNEQLGARHRGALHDVLRVEVGLGLRDGDAGGLALDLEIDGVDRGDDLARLDLLPDVHAQRREAAAAEGGGGVLDRLGVGTDRRVRDDAAVREVPEGGAGHDDHRRPRPSHQRAAHCSTVESCMSRVTPERPGSALSSRTSTPPAPGSANSTWKACSERWAPACRTFTSTTRRQCCSSSSLNFGGGGASDGRRRRSTASYWRCEPKSERDRSSTARLNTPTPEMPTT